MSNDFKKLLSLLNPEVFNPRRSYQLVIERGILKEESYPLDLDGKPLYDENDNLHTHKQLLLNERINNFSIRVKDLLKRRS